jgi:hypothetical protein
VFVSDFTYFDDCVTVLNCSAFVVLLNRSMFNQIVFCKFAWYAGNGCLPMMNYWLWLWLFVPAKRQHVRSQICNMYYGTWGVLLCSYFTFIPRWQRASFCWQIVVQLLWKMDLFTIVPNPLCGKIFFFLPLPGFWQMLEGLWMNKKTCHRFQTLFRGIHY